MKKLTAISVSLMSVAISSAALGGVTSPFQETLDNVTGDCVTNTTEVGCAVSDGSLGNPNDMIECYSNATLSPPYVLTEFTYTVGVSTPPPDSLNLKVFEWAGAGSPGTLVTTIPLAPGDLTAGFHNLVLASPVSLPTADFCVGINSEPTDDGFRLLVDQTTYNPGTSWIKAPEACTVNEFTELLNISPPIAGNWCFTATIENEIEAAYGEASGKTVCTGGNTVKGNTDVNGNNGFESISSCDGPAIDLDNEEIFVEGRVGLLIGTGTSCGADCETFPYTGTPTFRSLFTFKAKDPAFHHKCEYTPTEGSTATIGEDSFTITDWQVTCRWGDEDVIFTQTVTFTNGTGEGKGRDKDRGSISFPPGVIDFFVFQRGNIWTGETMAE